MSPFPLPYRLVTSGLLAAAGMIHELALAQILSVVLGGTLLQYSITIGLFTFALGIASLGYPRVAQRLRAPRPFALLLGVSALTAVGAGFAYLPLFEIAPRLSPWLAAGLAYFPAVLVGLLTGLELPVLLDGGDASTHAACLAADYAGMFLGTLLFPLVLLPLAGPLGAICAAAAVSGACAAASLALGRRA